MINSWEGRMTFDEFDKNGTSCFKKNTEHFKCQQNFESNDYFFDFSTQITFQKKSFS